MKRLAIVIMIFAFASAKCQEEKRYLVKEIKSKNSWNIVYLEHDSILFKVVNQKSENSDCVMIRVGEYYDLKLKPRGETVPEIDGIKLNPINKLDIECFAFDKETEICIEPERGINDIYFTKDLKGLCYLDKN